MKTQMKLEQENKTLREANARQMESLIALQKEKQELQAEYDAAMLEHAHIAAYLSSQLVRLRTREQLAKL